LNPDTAVRPTFLRELVSFLEHHPEAGAAGPQIFGKEGEHQITGFPLPTLATEAWRLLHLDRFYEFASYPLTFWRSDEPQRVDVIQGACILIRRAALEQTGLLDERFFIYTEEVDLCHRLLDSGWQIYWVPRAVIVHHGGASTSQVGGKMFLELYRSKVQYFRKYSGFGGALAYKTVLLVATLPRLLLTPLVLACVPSRRDECRSLLKKYSSLLVQLPAL
jgi:GT2 family glycosyltransferase